MRWIPIGSWEPHGPHLPYDTDTIIARRLAELASESGDLILPAIPYGSSWEHRETGEPVSLRVATLCRVMMDITETSSDPLVIVNGHGGNQWLTSLVQEVNSRGHRALLLPNAREWQLAYQASRWDFGSHDDMHAGAMETSLLLAWVPHKVRMPLPEDHAAPNRPLFHGDGIKPYAPNGYIGFPRHASAEAGDRVAAALVGAMREVVALWRR